MRTKTGGSAAVAVAAVLVFAGSGAQGHEAHKKKAAEAAELSAQAEVPVVAPPTVVADDNTSHDHSDHSDPSRAPAPTPAPGHDEESDALGVESNVPKPLAWLGKFHPPLTHFPIALLVAAALAELLFMRSGKQRFEHAVHFTVWFGALAALAAATLGWFFAGFRLFDEEWLMTLHRWAGTTTALLAAGLLYSLERLPRPKFRVVLLATAALVGATGFLGGALLYGLDHYAW